ncbi:hypothetical protein AF335_07490 [Streptomyces eurocidicus]|uniref:Uncharacterized protein n=1 Tax=Streptomyces eurocidicus TaxID=66423 RepID=A0A2N8P094_STREU|nr:hypothetical protein [Streptomyces eurocidicus]MBB5118979.1 hypothetical protein [Streptomyces eurocidicus]MBF6051214.1 hypothetical protein [Streptomyces eurocidicus]PNE34430.1 hypothetical protein AF335_07490 [Streptomyces eurocidicus]
MTTHPTEQSAPADDTPVTFHDHLLPGIEAGRYRITVDQRLPAEDLPGARLDPVEQIVDVRAAQFRLDPSWVHAVYPAAHSQGPFHSLLPHITLNPAALPWEREPFTGGVRNPTRAPWLALLLFGEGELPGDPNALGTTASLTVRALLDGAAAVSGPALDRDAVDPALLDTPCQVIDVPRDLLAQLLPELPDLAFLAHVRTGGEDAAPVEGRDGRPGRDAHAVITTARFPGPAQGRYVAHLVSLEGHTPPGVRADGKPVRLVSLHSWTFTSCPESGDGFGRLAGRFAPGNGEHSAAPLRPAPAAGLPDELGTLLEQGMVPLTHITESGERALAWYSGPFLPRVAPGLPRPADGHFPDADGLLLHEPRTGTFATGYACAWNTGRALALADPGFATTLVRLRHQGRLRRATDRQYATYRRQLFHSAPSAGPAPRTAARAATPTPREQFEELLRGGELAALAATFGVPEGEEPRPRTVRAAPTAYRAAPPRRSAAPRPTSSDARETAAWLAGLRTLSGVPFDCLVPDQRMLPPESLRLFHVDRGWLDALLDGARSLDRHPGADATTDAELDDLLDGQGPVPAAGLLLRSALVPGWPTLRVEARTASGTVPVEVIRREALGADVLLMLFERMPDHLTISEPRQGLHFGVDDQGNVALRSLAPGEVGRPLERSVPVGTDPALTVTTPAGARVLNIGGLAARLAEDVKPGSALSPAEFAVQLVRAPEQLTLSFEGTTR